jgi:hypothetical protein
MPQADNHLGLAEAQIDLAPTAALAIAHAAHDVIGFIGDVLNGADIVGMLYRETAVIERGGGHWQ